MIDLRATEIAVSRGGTRILKEVSFRAEPGMITGIIGPNGAGKSTLLGALSGDLPCSHGTVEIDGRDIHAIPKPALARLRAVMPQHHHVSFGFTTEEVVRMGCVSHSANSDRMKWAMARTDVVHLRHRRFRSLSGGEQARVAMARILAQDTPVLLLDEPTASLDLRHKELVMQVARDEAATGRTVVVVVHDLNLGAAYTDRMLLLKDGSVVADDTTRNVLVPSRVGTAYEVEVAVVDHPTRPCPLIVTIPGGR
jgi:iron complex transport system ATP-binding protein